MIDYSKLKAILLDTDLPYMSSKEIPGERISWWLFFQKSNYIFDEIFKKGVSVNPDDHMFYDYSICFDFESVLTKVEISNSEELRWSQRHDPISVSISSNVPGYTKENCIIDDDCDNLTENGSVFRKN